MIPRDWSSFLERARPSVDWQEAGRLICLDPGETTGWAIFDRGLLTAAGQWRTIEPYDLWELLTEQINQDSPRRPEVIVFEEYRVRGNRFKEHVGSEVVTIQLVGAIKVAADREGVRVAKQGAGLAKGFCTDRKLRTWGLYQTGLRHANDAVRHGCYYLLRTYGRT